MNYLVDFTAPSINNLTNSTPTGYSVTITWDTNETTNSFVCYGTNETTVNNWTGCTNSSWTNATTSISIGLTGLTNNTTYYYKPYSVDGSGNANTSVLAQNFTTADTITDAKTVPLSIFMGLGGAIIFTPYVRARIANSPKHVTKLLSGVHRIKGQSGRGSAVVARSLDALYDDIFSAEEQEEIKQELINNPTGE